MNKKCHNTTRLSAGLVWDVAAYYVHESVAESVSVTEDLSVLWIICIYQMALPLKPK